MDFGIIIEVVPGDEEKRVLLEQLTKANHNSLINEADYFQVYELLSKSNFKQARYFLSRAIKREKDAEHQRKMELMKQQSDGNAQAAIAAEEAKAKVIELEYEKKKELIELESALRPPQESKNE